jgi:hypothetical protein
MAPNPSHHSSSGKVGVITYDTSNGIISLKKHVSNHHPQKLKKWIANIEAKKDLEGVGQACKKRTHPSPSSITNFFGAPKPYHKNEPSLLEELGLYIAKSHCCLLTIEDAWLKQLVLWQCGGKVVLPSRHQLVNEVLPTLVTKTMENFVNSILANCITCMTTFDLWMQRGGHDIFALVISFINALWQPCHVTIIGNIVGTTMGKQMKDLLGSFGNLNKVIAFVKDKGVKLKIITTTLKGTVSCDMLDLPTPFLGTCWGHVMSKTAQYATDDSKVCRSLREASLKLAQSK